MGIQTRVTGAPTNFQPRKPGVMHGLKSGIDEFYFELSECENIEIQYMESTQLPRKQMNALIITVNTINFDTENAKYGQMSPPRLPVF